LDCSQHAKSLAAAVLDSEGMLYDGIPRLLFECIGKELAAADVVDHRMSIP